MTKTTTTLLLLAVLACALPASAQDPCTSTPPTGVALNPSKVYATLVDQATTIPSTSPAVPTVTNYVVGYFPQGQGPTGTPTFTTQVSKSAFTLVAGSTNCYVASGITLSFASQGTVYVGYLQAHRDAFTDGAGGSQPAADSAWSTASNPFVSVPLALTAPGRPTIRQ